MAMRSRSATNQNSSLLWRPSAFSDSPESRRMVAILLLVQGEAESGWKLRWGSPGIKMAFNGYKTVERC